MGGSRPGGHHGQQQGLRGASPRVGGLEDGGGEEDEAALRGLRGPEERSSQTER